MNSDTPFNPIPIPDSLLLAQETISSPPPPLNNPGAGATKKKTASRKRRRKQRIPQSSEVLEAAKQSCWQRIKGQFNARFSGMDAETLKRILTAAGVAAGVIIAILIAIKVTPIGLVLLAVLGLSVVLRIWGRSDNRLPAY